MWRIFYFLTKIFEGHLMDSTIEFYSNDIQNVFLKKAYMKNALPLKRYLALDKNEIRDRVFYV